jgi:hypothetical protein
MADLKTALTTALEKTTLQAWEDDDQRIQQEKQMQTKKPIHNFSVTNNVSRETFNYVRDNPTGTVMDARDALVAQGYKKTSVTSLITQMLRQGMIVKNSQGLLYTNLKEYTPLKSNKKTAKQVARKPYTKRQPSDAGIAALQADIAEILKPAWTTSDVLDKLTVIQARALYDELMRIFTGG